MARANRRRRQRDNATDWAAVNIGIITVATIIVAATVAAAISTNRETVNWNDARIVPAVIALGSLWFYFLTVLSGLWAVFRESTAEQRMLTKLTVIGFYAQVFTVVTFAVVAILGPLIAPAPG